MSRLRLLAGAVLLLATLAAVAGLAEWLRHPSAITPTPELYEAADPRHATVCPPPPGADEIRRVSSNDLYACPHVFDGRTVVFEGEVVGAVLKRPHGAWVQLNDDAYAGALGPLPAHREFRGGNAGVGVHLPGDLAHRIERVGNHRTRGDVLTVTGTYHLSDAVSGEVAVIRAHELHLARRGAPIVHEPLGDRRVAGVLLGLAAVVLLGAGRLTAGRKVSR